MRYASIDIGTNTLRILIGEIEEYGRITSIYKENVITRLGSDFTQERGISEDSMKRTLDVLRSFSKTIALYDVRGVYAVATSVVRRAVNGVDFVRLAKDKAGIDITVVSGEEEARLSMLGVISILKDPTLRYLIMDIGGGSTEFIIVDAGDMVGLWSMEMGVVHLTERHIINDPPNEDEVRGMEGEISGVLERLQCMMDKDGIDAFSRKGQKRQKFVGTAGTITTLAAMDQGINDYNPERINNYVLTRDKIKLHYRRLVSLALEDRKMIPGIEKGREDIIIAGASIALKTMDFFDFEEMIVSDSGLLEGILIDRIKMDKTRIVI